MFKRHSYVAPVPAITLSTKEALIGVNDSCAGTATLPFKIARGSKVGIFPLYFSVSVMSTRRSTWQKMSGRTSSPKEEMPTAAEVSLTETGSSTGAVPPDKRRGKEPLTADDIPNIVRAVVDALPRSEVAKSTPPPSNPGYSSTDTGSATSFTASTGNPPRQSTHSQELGKVP